jgi:hypothetical protein
MSLFLEEYYKRTQGTAELGSVLSDIQLNKQNGLPMDPAAWDDWMAAVESVSENQSHEVS